MNAKAKGREISFAISKTDRMLAQQIVRRWMRMVIKKFPKMTQAQINDETTGVMMDIVACHANGNRLDLERLLAADDFNFAHDVSGIGRHLDRTTGKLTNCFLPRFSAPKRNLRGRTSRADYRAAKSVEAGR